MKRSIITNDAPSAAGPYSEGIEINGTVFVSGQLPVHPETGQVPDGIAAQTNQTFENIKKIVEEAGGTMNDIVKCSVFMRDLEDFAEMNQVYKTFFQEPYPARVTVEVSRFLGNMKIEIDAIAVLK
jgi:2-iminobutanoate/2-iminopropanoate deaminase